MNSICFNDNVKHLNSFKMRKQILIIAVLIGFFTLNFCSLMAQEPPGGRPPMEHVDELTATQVKTVNKILSEYDSKSLSADDAQAIMEALMKAEIPPGKGVETAVEDAGFDFEEIRRLAPPPSKPGNGPQRQ
jgi:ABC-type microcin C transport system permease subunit YejB